MCKYRLLLIFVISVVVGIIIHMAFNVTHGECAMTIENIEALASSEVKPFVFCNDSGGYCFKDGNISYGISMSKK